MLSTNEDLEDNWILGIWGRRCLQELSEPECLAQQFLYMIWTRATYIYLFCQLKGTGYRLVERLIKHLQYIVNKKWILVDSENPSHILEYARKNVSHPLKWNLTFKPFWIVPITIACAILGILLLWKGNLAFKYWVYTPSKVVSLRDPNIQFNAMLLLTWKHLLKLSLML